MAAIVASRSAFDSETVAPLQRLQVTDNAGMWPSLSALVDHLALAQLPLPGALAGMLLVALLAATVLPLGSEAAFVLLLHSHPEWTWALWLAATVGNTLGSAITYAMGRGAGRWLPRPSAVSMQHPRAHSWLAKHGAAACVLGWLPVIGDAICALAGWLRLPAASCMGWIALGKGARYGLLILLGA